MSRTFAEDLSPGNMERTDLNLRMLDLARFHIGVLEAGGANRGPMVERFQKAVDGKAQGEPWCMAFVQFLIKAVIEVHGSKTLAYESESCLEVWNKTQVGQRLALPTPGLLAIWQHGSGPTGHVGIVSEVAPSFIKTVEGNTGPGVGIVREGDGVYMRVRSCTRAGDTIGNMKLLGFLKVF